MPSLGVGKRSWTRTSGIVPLVSGATIVGVCLAAGLTGGTVRAVLAPAVLLLGLAVGIVWHGRSGAAATGRRVAAARVAWASSRHGAEQMPDGAADPRDVALALPRGWRVESARGRLMFVVAGKAVHAETWVLRAAGGSRRAPDRREIVRVDAPTGGERLWLAPGVQVDPLLVAPAWGRSPDVSGPAWLPAVRDRVAVHDDVLASLTIGDDRVILFALDDPRPETMLKRAELVRDVAAIIQAAQGRP